jgi:hypothetical protein
MCNMPPIATVFVTSDRSSRDSDYVTALGPAGFIGVTRCRARMALGALSGG